MATDVYPGAAGVEFTDAQIQLMKRTICKPKHREATNDELSLFIGQCKRTMLDPFSRQIYAIFRWSKADNREVMTIQTAIDGFRVIAERSGRYLGQEGPYWCGDDGAWKEIWTPSEPPTAAKVLVKKVVAGQVALTPAVAHFREYAPKRDGRLQGLWPTMPAGQLAKCAEALSLRKALPNDLSGLYIEEEMQRADVEAAAALPAGQPVATAESVMAAAGGAPTGSGHRPLSDQDRSDLVELCATRGHEDMTLLLTAVSAESTDDLTYRQRDEILSRLIDGTPTSETVNAEPVEVPR
jgi:phage recombination protein Bet